MSLIDFAKGKYFCSELGLLASSNALWMLPSSVLYLPFPFVFDCITVEVDVTGTGSRFMEGQKPEYV
jgi:hypothetical protein